MYWYFQLPRCGFLFTVTSSTNYYKQDKSSTILYRLPEYYIKMIFNFYSGRLVCGIEKSIWLWTWISAWKHHEGTLQEDMQILRYIYKEASTVIKSQMTQMIQTFCLCLLFRDYSWHRNSSKVRYWYI